MYAFLTHIDPKENMNRWYEVSVQPTLIDKVAVVRRWGSRETAMQQMMILPMGSIEEARQMAEEVITEKLKGGYIEG